METNTVRKFRWFWPWQDEIKEAWLRKMSQDGWHVASVGWPGIYTFTAGQPQDYIYHLDFIFRLKDRQAYLQWFRDAGWEHVGEMSVWQYFRKPVQEGEAPELYPDVESKVDKYRRLLVFEVITLCLLGVSTRWFWFPSIWHMIIQGFIILLLMIYLYIVIRTWRRIIQLKRL